MEGLTIGEVAEQANVHVETFRYYERRGLVARPPRSPAKYRLYSQDTVRRVRFIKRAQALAFSLGEIQELLALRVAPQARCADVRQYAETKITEIDEKIAALVAMKYALSTLVMECSRDGPLTDCPILEARDIKETIS